MGHGVEVRERIYLRWINAERGLAGMQAWLENQLEAKQDDKDALQASMSLPSEEVQLEPTSASAVDPQHAAVMQRLEELEKALEKEKRKSARWKK